MSVNENSSAISLLCSEAEHLAHNVYLWLVMGVKICAYIYGAFGAVGLLRAKKIQLAVHKNVKILLLNLYLSLLIQCTSKAAFYIQQLGIFAYYTKACDYMRQSGACLISNSFDVTWGVVSGSLTALAIERVVASVNFRNYETWTNRLGIGLIIFLWTSSAASTVYAFKDYSETGPQAFCSYMTKNNQRFLSVSTVIGILIEIACLITFYQVLKRNRLKKAGLLSGKLTERYQLDENYRVSKLMIPLIWSHFAFLLPPLVFFLVYGLFFTINPSEVALVSESANLMPYYCAVMPTVFLWKHRHLRVNAKMTINPEIEGKLDARNHYFNSLKAAWDIEEANDKKPKRSSKGDQQVMVPKNLETKKKSTTTVGTIVAEL